MVSGTASGAKYNKNEHPAALQSQSENSNNSVATFASSTFSVFELCHALSSKRSLDRARFDRLQNLHTMRDALHTYASSKVPMLFVNTAISDQFGCEVHGTYPPNAVAFLRDKGHANLERIEFKTHSPEKKTNFVRPSFFLSRTADRLTLIAAVTPGSDYVEHYSRMIAFALRSNKNFNGDVRVFRYPRFEQNFTSWSGLNEKFIGRGDRVVLGYAENFKPILDERQEFEHISSVENDCYSSERYVVNGEIINLLGVKFSFWGNMSEKISDAVCEYGAKEIIYFSKIGSINCQDALYEKIYTPENFIIMNDDDVVETFRVPNALSQPIGGAHEDAHVTIPTVMEETFSQRETAHRLGARSIDNEVGYIARSVKRHNEKADQRNNVTFSSVAFSTDYLYAEDEPFESSRHNLSTNKSDHARALKQNVMHEITTRLTNYLLRG